MPCFDIRNPYLVAREALDMIQARGCVLAHAEARRRARQERERNIADPAEADFWEAVQREVARITKLRSGG